MMTSYFWHPDVQPGKRYAEFAVSIARWPPRSWRGLRDITLAPPVPLMIRARAGEFRTAKAFEKEYRHLVLDSLDPFTVLERHRAHILLCYEAEGPCHRRIVARWVERECGVTVNEL
jgi:hypothetical protein